MTTSTDHKSIGLEKIGIGVLALVVGTLLSLLMRLHLAFPDHPFNLLSKWIPSGMEGGFFSPEFYLSLVTIHGTIMIFFVLTVIPIGGFGNYLLPLQIGAPNLAFPRLGQMSMWLTLGALLILLSALLVADGAPLNGWTAYPPLSALGGATGPGQGTGMNLWLLSLALFCLATQLDALNLLVTSLSRRAPGLSLGRLPLTVWAWITTSVLVLLSFPVLVAAAVLLFADRLFSTGFFVPDGILVAGEIYRTSDGSPLLWQHLFWFFGHPEVYIAILPVMGMVSHILATFVRRPVAGYPMMVAGIVAIAVLGFLVWGHHMFVSGMNPYAVVTFSFLTLAIGVPSAMKTIHWLRMLVNARLRLSTAFLWCLGFVSVFVSGGLTGIYLGQTSLDVYLHDTYFVVGHFHLIMGVAVVFGLFGATYYWYPKMTGRLLSERLGKVHFLLTFVGVHGIFVPMLLLGLRGHPRRYYDARIYEYLSGSDFWQVFMTIAALLVASAQLFLISDILWRRRRGKPAGDNPWQATTLEWATTSPPPVENFTAGSPIVHHGAYEYVGDDGRSDFIPQNAPPKE